MRSAGGRRFSLGFICRLGIIESDMSLSPQRCRPVLSRVLVFLVLGAWRLVPSAMAQADYEDYTFITLAGQAPGWFDGAAGAALFNQPFGVAADASGNVYVADTFNNTIRKVSSSGEVTTLAGLAGSPGSTDGSGQAARFNFPSGVAVDGSNNVYVADSLNHTIRKVTPGVWRPRWPAWRASPAAWMAPAAAPGSTARSPWRSTPAATCMWRTPPTARFVKSPLPV